MNQPSQQPEKRPAQYLQNLTLASVAGQVGCLTLGIIFIALFGGLWLDNHFDTRPVFTIVLVVASVPFTLVATMWVAQTAVSRIKANPSQDSTNSAKEDLISE